MENDTQKIVKMKIDTHSNIFSVWINSSLVNLIHLDIAEIVECDTFFIIDGFTFDYSLFSNDEIRYIKKYC